MIYNSILEIPKFILEEIDFSKSKYFGVEYLESLSKNSSNFKFLVVFDENKIPIALAVLFAVDFYLNKIEEEILPLVGKIKCIGKKLGVFRLIKPYKMLICGNPYVSGEHGLFIKENQDRVEVIKRVKESIYSYFKEKDFSLLVFKDFKEISLEQMDSLLGSSFCKFKVEPNMKLELSPNWFSFNDYLNEVRSKTRGKYRKVSELSSSLTVFDINGANIQDYLPEMLVLYENMTESSAFNLVDFNLDTYIDLLKLLHEAFFIKGYLLNGKLVGFMSALHVNSNLDAHFVGIDYGLNRKYAIYQRILFDYVKLAIDKRCKVLNLGRTASEIKSSIGAEVEDLTIYVRHKNRLANKILELFLKKIKVNSFELSRVFKVKKISYENN